MGRAIWREDGNQELNFGLAKHWVSDIQKEMLDGYLNTHI